MENSFLRSLPLGNSKMFFTFVLSPACGRELERGIDAGEDCGEGYVG